MSKVSVIFLPKIAVNPSMRNMFVMFDPMTFPTTISEEFFKTAKIDEISSGKDVPNATMDTPMMKEGIPKNRPTFSAVSVK